MAMNKNDLKKRIINNLTKVTVVTPYLDDFIDAIASAVVDEVLRAEVSVSNSSYGSFTGNVVR